MKTPLLVFFFLLGLISCTKRNQPKCTDADVQRLLKEICAEESNRDTSEIQIDAIRTINKNEEFNSCECAANIKAEGRAFSFMYLKPIDEDVTYTAQITDDGNKINVRVD